MPAKGDTTIIDERVSDGDERRAEKLRAQELNNRLAKVPISAFTTSILNYFVILIQSKTYYVGECKQKYEYKRLDQSK